MVRYSDKCLHKGVFAPAMCTGAVCYIDKCPHEGVFAPKLRTGEVPATCIEQVILKAGGPYRALFRAILGTVGVLSE